MALYAFDSTWNKDQELDERDTNVRKFFEISAEPDDHKLYTSGVGTRFGVIALRWMARKAAACGVPLDEAKLTAMALDAGIDPNARLKLPKDFIPNAFRSCGTQDRVHCSVGTVTGRPDKDDCNPFTFTVVETEADERTARALV